MSPIDCQQVLQQIELYLDGELDPAMGVEMRRHLGACSPCMDHADFKRHLRELLKAKCGCDEVPPHVLDRVRSLLSEEQDRPIEI
ncbi:MAG: mycothiol system anti-sigma-R factor [Candidatus Velamenicoccus archaeovorus]